MYPVRKSASSFVRSRIQILVNEGQHWQFCNHDTVCIPKVAFIDISVLLRKCRGLHTYHFSLMLSLTSAAPGSGCSSLCRMFGCLFVCANWHFFTNWDRRRSIWPWSMFWGDSDVQRRVNCPSARNCIQWSGVCTENMLQHLKFWKDAYSDYICCRTNITVYKHKSFINKSSKYNALEKPWCSATLIWWNKLDFQRTFYSSREGVYMPNIWEMTSVSEGLVGREVLKKPEETSNGLALFSKK
jgi:hypothetical protein